MAPRSQLILLLTASLFAAGVHWDALQVFAWSRMFAENARTLPTLAALRQTFDPQAMCGVCCVVQEAKREQRQAAAVGADTGKAPLVLLPMARVIVAVPVGRAGFVWDSIMEDVQREAPPVPPPRVAA